MHPDTAIQIMMSKLERVEKGMEILVDLLPLRYDLGELSRIVDRPRDTLRKHLYSHYRDGRDYWQQSKHGKIYVARDAALSIRRHYAQR